MILVLVSLSEQFVHIGCYVDKAANAIVSLKGKDPLLDKNPELREDAVQRCARVAISTKATYILPSKMAGIVIRV